LPAKSKDRLLVLDEYIKSKLTFTLIYKTALELKARLPQHFNKTTLKMLTRRIKIFESILFFF
jgi:hypothetical protein